MEKKELITLNKKNKGIIKSGNYEIEITTLASKIEISDNVINLDYKLWQEIIDIK